MGSGSSARFVEGTNNEIVAIMMPVYYVEETVSPEDLKLASASWQMIINDTSPEFKRKRTTDPDFTQPSCISWFFNSFYTRLFDVHPLCRPMFKNGLQTQGKFLIQMVSLCLNQLTGNQEGFEKTMTDLTTRHCERGIKAIEYGVVGDVLFWCIQLCVGREVFTERTQAAWVRIYSVMLRIIVPVAVLHERRGEYASKVVRGQFKTPETAERSDAETFSAY